MKAFLHRLWDWAVLLVSGGVGIAAVRLGMAFWSTAAEEESAWLWYSAALFMGLLFMLALWEGVRRVRLLVSPVQVSSE